MPKALRRFHHRGGLTLLFILMAWVFPCRVASQSPPAGWTDFTRLFDSMSDQDKVVGASILVLHDGRVVARHEHGLADRAKSKLVDEATIFHYGSITKTLTAIAIMQLRDRGRLSLDDHVTHYIPELTQVHNA